MKIVDTSIYNNVIKEINLNFGSFYFFENLVISEINEEEHLGAEKFSIIAK